MMSTKYNDEYKDRMVHKFGKRRVNEVDNLRNKMLTMTKDYKGSCQFLKTQIKRIGGIPSSDSLINLSIQHAHLMGREYKTTIEERICNKGRAVRYTKIEIKRYIKELIPYETREYSEYLKSKQWKLVRELVISERQGKCERCKSDKYLQVHHKNYSTLFNENLDDLELLCQSCHMKEHGLK